MTIQRKKHQIRTTRIAGGLHCGYKPWLPAASKGAGFHLRSSPLLLTRRHPLKGFLRFFYATSTILSSGLLILSRSVYSALFCAIPVLRYIFWSSFHSIPPSLHNIFPLRNAYSQTYISDLYATANSFYLPFEPYLLFTCGLRLPQYTFG